MKLAIFSESTADEAAARIIADALLGTTTTSVAPTLRARSGWSSVFGLLPAVIKRLHYHSDAEALVAIIDSDNSPVHDPADVPSARAACRLCRLQHLAQVTLAGLAKRTHAPPLRVAFGLAVPNIEAWLAFGKVKGVSEAAWRTGRPGYSGDDLKIELYDTIAPTLDVETARMIEEATRVSTRLDELRAFFPNGFGPFCDDIRAWRAP